MGSEIYEIKVLSAGSSDDVNANYHRFREKYRDAIEDVRVNQMLFAEVTGSDSGRKYPEFTMVIGIKFRSHILQSVKDEILTAPTAKYNSWDEFKADQKSQVNHEN